MLKMCEVPFCKEIGAHQFPKDSAMTKKWLKAIRRQNFKPEKNSRLCRKHFLETDYLKSSFYTGIENKHRYLKKTAVPTLFPWTTKTLSQEAQAREDRLSNRNIRKALFEQTETSAVQTTSSEDLSLPDNVISTQDHHTNTPDFVSEQYIEAEVTEKLEKTIPHPAQYKSSGTQTSAALRIFSTDLLFTDNEGVMFYTGLESYSKLNLVLNTLLPMANNLKYRWSQVVGMSVEDQFLVLLIKIRRNNSDYEISKMFNVSKTVVSNILGTWILFIYNVWSLIDIWPRRDLVDYYMPEIFKDHNNKTRVIIDATEIPIAKPSNPISQRATYSSYKNTNTIKFLVGSTPGGLLSYCSRGYGGATSDRQMIERSSLINLCDEGVIERSSLINLCDEGDSVMADRGFNVQDLFAVKNV